MNAPMQFAFADPPYLGCGKLYDAQHEQSRHYDEPKSHHILIARLCDEYPDGWALCCSSVSYDTIRAMCPPDVRIGIWVKPFASFKPNVNPAYAYEMVIFRGGRKRTREQETIRDWVSANITLKRGLTGAKPREFCRWVFAFLNAQPQDKMADLFPGTGAVSAAWADWCGEQAAESAPLFAATPERNEMEKG